MATPSSRPASDLNNIPVSSANNASNAQALQQLAEEGESLPKYKRDLVAKLKIFRQELQTQQPPSGHCRLEVSRQDVFEDSYR
jgi:E3 ubiquitin ligase SMURF1/2